jgi:hypothetical protein
VSEPIKSGDSCLVIGGLGRSKSPNIGKTVTVASMQGEHSQHGRVWRCTGDGVCQLGDAGNYVVTGWADFPVSWLQKIDPTPTDKTQTTEKEITA